MTHSGGGGVTLAVLTKPYGVEGPTSQEGYTCQGLQQESIQL